MDARYSLEIDDTQAITAITDYAFLGDGAALDGDGNPPAGYAGTHNLGVVTVSGTTITAIAAGTTVVTYAHSTDREANADRTYEVTVLPFGIKSIKSDDSDNTVKAGTPVQVTVTLQSQTNNSEVTLTLPTTGLSIVKATEADGTPLTGADEGTTQQETIDTANADATEGAKTATFRINTAGAPDGVYVFTFVAEHDDTDGNTADTTDATRDVTDTSFTLTVGDPGAGLASAALAPNNVDSAGNPSLLPTATPDKTTKAKGSTIQLVVVSSNSLGERSNDGDVSQVIVFAVGAVIDSDDPASENSKTYSGAGAVQAFSVTRATAGTVTVSATVVGKAGDVKTNELVLTFTGDAENISLGAPSDVLGQGGPGTEGDSITVEVTATDDADNVAAISPLQTTSVTIKNADGNPARNISHTETQKQDNKGTPDDDSDDEDIPTAVVITISTGTAAKAEAGTYTLEVKLGSKDTATVEFAVTGAAANVALEVDNNAPGDDDNFVTATATVTDKDGNPVVDGTPVTFSASGNNAILDLIEVEGGHKTEGGIAKADFFVVGAGRSLVGATSGSGRDAEPVISTAGAAPAAEAADCGLAGLNRLSGFASWDCDADTSASALFDLLSSRGATAIHLWNGSAWVRYAVVDGNEIPGSTDFMVTDGDNLYISN
ncbi:MAG: hypothetical protein OXI41_14885 [Chloroflexota bacterium]|nr:hypothetical protein [Chloroflexota bacterium]MDE2895854.1 hypothetical protein [Chloroflexota bacterium]